MAQFCWLKSSLLSVVPLPVPLWSVLVYVWFTLTYSIRWCLKDIITTKQIWKRTKRIWKGYSRLKNQSASIDASGSSWFFFVSERSKKKKSGGLGVNKRNRGYPADFEFIFRKAHNMFNASVRPSVRPSVCLSVCLKPKFCQLFDVSCLNLRASAERTCNKKTKSGPTFYVLYMFCNSHFLLRKICFVAQQIYYKVLWWISSTTPATIVDWCIEHLPNWCLLHNSRRKYRVDSDWNSDTVALYHASTYILTYG